MAAHVHVILKRDVDKLGHAGELVRVRPGYARNYLLPRTLAVIATDDNVRQTEHERKLAVAAAAKQKGLAEGIASARCPFAKVRAAFSQSAPRRAADRTNLVPFHVWRKYEKAPACDRHLTMPRRTGRNGSETRNTCVLFKTVG